MAVEWVKADRYRRKLGKVLLAGLDCNLVQVKRGLAWYCQSRHIPSFAALASFELAYCP